MKFDELKTWIKSYAVFRKMGGHNFSGYKIISSARRGLSELEKELMPIYAHYFSAEIEKYKAMPLVQDELSDMPIWVCWWQGMDNMPDVVANCYKRLKHVYPDRKINFVCKENYHSYVSMPENILNLLEQGRISVTFFSDYLRACLLYEHGGFWIDATVFCIRQFPESFFNRRVFSIKILSCPDEKNTLVPFDCWSSFGIGSTYKRCKVFGFIRDCLKKLYLQFGYNPYYFSLDMLIRTSYMQFDDFRSEIRSLPVSSPRIHVFAGIWNERCDYDYFCNLCKNNEVFKLNAKWHVDEKKKDTWHDFFCSDKSLYWPQ